MALSDWQILLIAVVVVGSLGALVAFKTRLVIDVNRDGSVNPSEVPIRVQNNFKDVVVKGPGIYDLTIESLYRTLLQSFMHAFCYGCQMVFLCNWAMPNMDRRYAYIITVSMVFKACMFMCMYSNNGIHIVTKHVVHFIYYGCAFLSLFFYWWTPVDHSWLVAVYALAILLTYTAGRFYGLPNYPGIQKIIRLYKLEATTGNWVLGSTPQLLSGDISTEVEPPRSEYTQWACTFPAFEIFNGHISSSFTWGVLVAVIINAVVNATDFVLPFSSKDTTTLYLSIAAAMVVALLYQSIGLYGRTENKLHLGTLSRFWPRSSSMFSAALGAASAVVNLVASPFTGDAQEAGDATTNSTMIVEWVGYGALIVAILMTYVTAFVAARAFFKQKQQKQSSQAEP